MSKRPPGTIEIRSPDPATPERVARMAQLVLETVRAAGIDPSELTLTVDNRTMRAQVRPWTPNARIGLSRVADVLKNPTKAIDQHYESREIALALSSFSAESFPGGLVLKKAEGRSDLGQLNEVQAKQLGALGAAAREAASIIRGSSQAYSKILRVGRVREGDQHMRVRFEFKGQMVDIPLAEDADASPIFLALQKDSWCRLWLEIAWERRPDDSLKLVERSSRIVKAIPFQPVTGQQFLAEARSLFEIPVGAAQQIIEDRGTGE